jgi:hypothetical protein
MASPTSSTGPSVSSSSRMSLNEADHSPIIVYHHKKGLYLSSQHELFQKLDKGASPTPSSPPSVANMARSADRTLRVSKKPIPWGNSTMEVHQGDLFPERDRPSCESWPNMRASLSSVRLPRSVSWKRLLLGRFREMYIVSPDASPQSSPEASQSVSPQDTFGRDVGGAEGRATHGGSDGAAVAVARAE